MPASMPIALLPVAPWIFQNQNPTAPPFVPDTSTPGTYRPPAPTGLLTIALRRGVPQGGFASQVAQPQVPDFSTPPFLRPMFFTTPGLGMLHDVPMLPGGSAFGLAPAPPADYATPGQYTPLVPFGNNPIERRLNLQPSLPGVGAGASSSSGGDVTLLPNLAPIVFQSLTPGNQAADGTIAFFGVEAGYLAIRVTTFASWDGTIHFEASTDGINWVPIVCTSLRTGLLESVAAATGLWAVRTGGLTRFRARHVPGTTGFVNVGGRWERSVQKGG